MGDVATHEVIWPLGARLFQTTTNRNLNHTQRSLPIQHFLRLVFRDRLHLARFPSLPLMRKSSTASLDYEVLWQNTVNSTTPKSDHNILN